MKAFTSCLALLSATALAQTPSNLVIENIPTFPDALAEKVQPYLEARTAAFQGWNPARAEMLISTRFGNTPQLHVVKMPGGARQQLTFFSDRVLGGGFRPNDPNTILFVRDTGGGEFFQFYRFDVGTGEITLVTDGKSRNTASVFSRDGRWLAFASTRRTAKDTDLYVADPMQPRNTRMVLQVEGGGWAPSDFSPDNKQILVTNEISANQSELYLLDLDAGTKRQLTPKGAPIAFGNGRFSRDGNDIYFLSDEGSEFSQLVRMHLADGAKTTLSHEKWDVDEFDISKDGKRIAYVTNENGIGVLHVADAATGAAVSIPKMPIGILGGVKWHPNNHLIGMTITSAKAPSDAYSLDVDSGAISRWTTSETGGLNASRNVDPQLVSMKSFDGTMISAFVYRPDAARFPGKRPALMVIHGGPEGQSRPGFLGRSNYWINELGIALVYPNVRGSSGYGKTYLAMDNGYKREDTVKDIGTVINWIKSDPMLDGDRIGVYGGSYGGYMTLATMTHYNDQMRAAIDIVGIASFITFFQNTSAYRADLRRVEYGDERDPKMHAFLEQISPLSSASKITRPLMVVAGFNDPRVPYTEGQQIVKAVRANNAPVWWLMAKDEGHGFAKKNNQDYLFLAMTEFLQQFLLQ
ncbi:MAG: prolyl oligopeptidase family serine peptidase [Acidobacteriota bacterium]|nr:prolyl oligopeptidase family serine peptidase [Acidobacteriota bacterium]